MDERTSKGKLREEFNIVKIEIAEVKKKMNSIMEKIVEQSSDSGSDSDSSYDSDDQSEEPPYNSIEHVFSSPVLSSKKRSSSEVRRAEEVKTTKLVFNMGVSCAGDDTQGLDEMNPKSFYQKEQLTPTWRWDQYRVKSKVTKSYVFSGELKSDEVIIQMGHHVLTRMDLSSLEEGQHITDLVVDAAVWLYTGEGGWEANTDGWSYMPVVFAEYILKRSTETEAVDLKRMIRGTTDPCSCHDMFIPMRDGQQWYVVLVEFEDKKVRVFDAMWDEGATKRDADVRSVLAFCDDMYEKRYFPGNASNRKVKLSSMPIEIWRHASYEHTEDSGLAALSIIRDRTKSWWNNRVNMPTRTRVLMDLVYCFDNLNNNRGFYDSMCNWYKATKVQGEEHVKKRLQDVLGLPSVLFGEPSKEPSESDYDDC
ncbi:uncharacterized protein LOC119996865 [Tripterygium wilfordii]|uniref:uncharacterized protein LOC119983479 n=1 Tax=Tripterygium wilfordii TaxID=458696 RepID=UPI0018F849FA|nr:uncharacterized protein LOC119983479 [Tripterygium wilfordii]XP_038699575.1 uncharacterized protein LOC119996865 [Tripterygium wilfordii]